MIFELLTLFIIVLLAFWVIIEDLRNLEIPAVPVLLLTALSIAAGILFPLPGLLPDHALWGACLGLSMGTITRSYIHWRSGVAAFGGADIALISAAGGLLGPFLFGPWLLAAAGIGIVMMLGSSIFVRKANVDNETLDVLPFCPALIASTGLTYLLAWFGCFPAGMPG